jgi:ribonucleoside-diphosphate reductase alpha chain
MSLALQYVVLLEVLCRKFSHMRFEPSGWSGNPEIGFAKSMIDYVARWLALRFFPPTFPPPTGAEGQSMASTPAPLPEDGSGEGQVDAPTAGSVGPS